MAQISPSAIVMAAANETAAPQPMCHLEDLPNELLLMILGELPPADFWPMLSASPRCFQVFQARKASALEAIVRRSIAPENLRLALAACGAPRIPSSTKPAQPENLPDYTEEVFFDIPDDAWDCPDDASDCSDETVTQLEYASAPSHLSALSDTVSDLSDDVSELSEIPPDRTEAGIGLTLINYQEEWESQQLESGNVELLSRLFKLSHVLETFVADYARDALKKLGSVLTPKSAAAAPALSATERARLQRAFLRFEIYRKVCLTGLLIHDWSPLKMRPAFWRWFMGPLAPWEWEQVSAVYAYLWSRVEETTFHLEQDLIQRVSSGLGIGKLRSAASIRDEAPGADQPMKDCGLAMFQMNGAAGTRQEQVEFVTAMGLPFLRHLWKGDLPKQTSLMTSHMWKACDGLLNDVLRERWQFDIQNPDIDVASYSGAVLGPSPGWLWLRRSQLPHPFHTGDARCRAQVREVAKLGLVFWDHARLQNMGLFSTTLKCVYHGVDETALYALHKRSARSVEELIGDPAISRSSWEQYRPQPFSNDDEEALLQKLEY